jgi:two-component system, NarL family, nitrate/nitrite response regulator NarL
MLKLVIVDDSELLRLRLKNLIASVNNLELIAEASNSLDALQIIKRKKPDILLLDIRMPGINGLEVLAEIRKFNKEMKVLIITNYSNDQYKMAAFKFGADYFLDKSTEFQQIPIILKNIVENISTYKDVG